MVKDNDKSVSIEEDINSISSQKIAQPGRLPAGKVNHPNSRGKIPGLLRAFRFVEVGNTSQMGMPEPFQELS